MAVQGQGFSAEVSVLRSYAGGATSTGDTVRTAATQLTGVPSVAAAIGPLGEETGFTPAHTSRQQTQAQEMTVLADALVAHAESIQVAAAAYETNDAANQAALAQAGGGRPA